MAARAENWLLKKDVEQRKGEIQVMEAWPEASCSLTLNFPIISNMLGSLNALNQH